MHPFLLEAATRKKRQRDRDRERERERERHADSAKKKKTIIAFIIKIKEVRTKEGYSPLFSSNASIIIS